MKGYRTPSWYRMKGFTKKKQDGPAKGDGKAGGLKKTARKKGG